MAIERVDILDADVRELFDELEELGLPTLSEEPAAVARETFRRFIDFLQRGVEPSDAERGIEARDEIVGSGPGVPVRIYEPSEIADARCDVVVFMHGGGWFVGDLDTHRHTAVAMAAALAARVVAVDYRRAPEHRFPAALDDCLSVVDSVSGDRRSRTVSVAGDSAGGNLAAAVALASRQAGRPTLTAQLLLYPALNPRRDGRSVDEFAEGFGLTRAEMAFYDQQYLVSRRNEESEFAAPAAASDLSSLPSAIIATAGADILLDEGRTYARRLVEHEVPTVYLPFRGLPHGWLDMAPRVPAATRARKLVFQSFRTVIDGSSTGLGADAEIR